MSGHGFIHAAVLCSVLGCGRSEYTLVMSGAKDAINDHGYLEIYIGTDPCSRIGPLGQIPDPANLVKRFRWKASDPPPFVGDLAPGPYSFYARAMNAECDVKSVACTDARVAGGGTGRIQVALSPIGGPRCNDGLACNGIETCDLANGCQAGTPTQCDDHIDCTHDVCTEPSGTCTFTADHAACPMDQLCDPSTGCVHPPACTTDAQCDDGKACNGTERCDPATGCKPGTPVDCDDHLACTVDLCVEPMGTCRHFPDHSLCTGAQLCTPAGCQAGHACAGDAECSDGVFCNGQEQCDNQHCAPDVTPMCMALPACSGFCDLVADACATMCR